MHPAVTTPRRCNCHGGTRFRIHRRSNRLVTNLCHTGDRSIISVPAYTIRVPNAVGTVHTVIGVLSRLGVPTCSRADGDKVVGAVTVQRSLTANRLRIALVAGATGLVRGKPLLTVVTRRLPRIGSIRRGIGPNSAPLI